MPSLAEMLAKEETPKGRRENDEKVATEGDKAPSDDDHAQVAKEVMEAMQAGDHNGFHEALKAYCKMAQE